MQLERIRSVVSYDCYNVRNAKLNFVQVSQLRGVVLGSPWYDIDVRTPKSILQMAYSKFKNVEYAPSSEKSNIEDTLLKINSDPARKHRLSQLESDQHEWQRDRVPAALAALQDAGRDVPAGTCAAQTARPK